MAETITNQAVNLDIESGDNINQICETVEANSDRRLNDDKDADQKELIPRDYQVAVIFIMLKWFQIYVSWSLSGISWLIETPLEFFSRFFHVLRDCLE